MKKLLLCTAVLAMVVCCAALIIAADEKAAPAGQPPAGMPPMGPPAEMKELAGLVGNWTYAMKMKMDPASDKMEELTGTCKMAYILDGAALTEEHESMMMGMKFKAIGIMTYDREMKHWQMTWTDNMGARTSMYTGTKTAANMVMTGEEMMGGMTSLTRVTTSNMGATSFDWKMEMSMDQGKTWMLVGTATYTKAK